MDDSNIISLYFSRSEEAIKETDLKYHKYCETIGMNILSSYEDTEECIYDSYLHTWNAIPPKRPNNLRVFLGKIMRNLCLDRFRRKTAQKRKGDGFAILLSELDECIPAATSVWDSYNEKMLGMAIDQFLDSLPEKERNIFLKRYFFCESMKEISRECALTVNNVKIILHRLRKRLKFYLQKEGYEI